MRPTWPSNPPFSKDCLRLTDNHMFTIILLDYHRAIDCTRRDNMKILRVSTAMVVQLTVFAVDVDVDPANNLPGSGATTSVVETAGLEESNTSHTVRDDSIATT